MSVLAGDIPIAFRQTCTVAFAGANPQNATPVTFEPFMVDGIVKYVNPDDHAEENLAQGGLFDFGDRAVLIVEVRAKVAAGNLTITVGDRADALHDVISFSGSGTRVLTYPLVVLPSQVLKITSGNAGWLDVYVIKGDGHL